MKLSLSPEDEEYGQSISVISEILKKHLKPSNPDRPLMDADHFQAVLSSFEGDLWSKEQVTIALEELSRTVQKLSSAFEAVPKLVRQEIEVQASGLDWEVHEKYLEECSDDIVFKSALPKPDASNGVKGLNALVKNQKTLVSVIKMVREGLPEGIQTRNRPRRAWAVIHAAVVVSKSPDRINVPKAIDQSGPMYHLLKDLFELFEIKETVAGAYKGWRKHVDGNYENFNLMPI